MKYISTGYLRKLTQLKLFEAETREIKSAWEFTWVKYWLKAFKKFFSKLFKIKLVLHEIFYVLDQQKKFKNIARYKKFKTGFNII